MYLFILSSQCKKGAGAVAWPPRGPQEPRAAGEGPWQPQLVLAGLCRVVNPSPRPLYSSSPKLHWEVGTGEPESSGLGEVRGPKMGRDPIWVSSALWGVQENSSSRWGDPVPRSPLLSFTCSPPLALRINGLRPVILLPTHTDTVPVTQWAPEGAQGAGLPPSQP